MVKNLVLEPILARVWPKVGLPFFFSKIWLHQSLDIMVSYHHVQYQKKTNDPILRKLSDKRTDEWMDKSDFIGRCPTNVECLITIRAIQVKGS